MRLRVAGVAALAVVAASAVSTAGAANADDSFLTVSGTVQCVGQQYTLTVPSSKLQSGTDSYYFLDGSTVIGGRQTWEPNQDATVTWTPTSSGTHNLFLHGDEPGAAYVIGPTTVTVLAANDPNCTTTPTPGGTGSADSIPVIGAILKSLGL
ncbi:hypothetical protein IU500_30650 [Nocardia terpenica]|uniref:hypothetical protein n=1 Tax=Nocardia terpenica TaxID=455432 RepID=UPI000A5C242F|nr:hypothetical protein [Nocardia terpenica]MBF6065860.1 hypothetical protein [Nocardia terpenica]MBF6108377.1 hypothetical protein [Nocardia terpenica]MBF6115975.1 hypothetical protein [Nocardia terpenica]MBF6123105.1 hypothetical protein [Nocardia terpenica]MBF6156221.1 hypothetical protein [Nocardia terpenica]